MLVAGRLSGGRASVLSGVLLFLVLAGSAAAADWLVQEHSRWRNDDGTEASATWMAGVDTPVTNAVRGVNYRVRIAIADRYGPHYVFGLTGVLQYATSTGGPWAAVSTVTNGLSPFEMRPTDGYTNGEPTTAQLDCPGGVFVPGVSTEYPTNAFVTVALTDSNLFSNFEFCLQPTAKARANTNYYFRIVHSVPASIWINRYLPASYPKLTMVPVEAPEAPRIVSSLTVTGSVLTGVWYKVEAAGGEPIAYRATRLPAGVTLSGQTITGIPTVRGSFPVTLTASNAFGVATQMLAMTIMDYQPPVAADQSLTLGRGSEQLVYVSWSDWDQPSVTAHTFTILDQPSAGQLTTYLERNRLTLRPDGFYYRADVGYMGTDTFTWVCNDGRVDSNTGTVTVIVTTNTPPIVLNTNVTATSGGVRITGMSVVDADAGQSYAWTVVTPPSNGAAYFADPMKIHVSYLAYPEFTGTDSFVVACNDGVDDSNMATVTVVVAAGAPRPQSSTVSTARNMPLDIPVSYLGGAGYSFRASLVSGPASGTLTQPDDLNFRYVPASNYTGQVSFTWRMQYWQAGGTTNNSSPGTCTIQIKEPTYGKDWPMWRYDEYRSASSLISLPADLRLQWRRDFPAPAPAWLNYGARFNWFDHTCRPVVMGKTVFVGASANDSLGAFDTATGTNLWTFYAGGPVRCAPAAVNGMVYFGSDDGWFYCLNATNGTVLWKFGPPTSRKLMGNKRLISVWPVRGGVACKDGKVYFAAGLWTAEGIFVYCLDAATGAVVWKNDSVSGLVTLMQHGHDAPRGFPPQGSLVFSTDGNTIFVPSGMSFPARVSAATGEVTWWAGAGSKVSGWGWYVDQSGASSYTEPVVITAGARNYTASSVSSLSGMAGTVGSIAAGDDRLFVMTRQGGLYCYGGAEVSDPPAYTLTPAALPETNDVWAAAAQAMLDREDLKQGLALVWGIGSGRLVEELARQTSALRIVAADPDAGKVAALRAKLDAAGLYGQRVTALAGNPMDTGFAESQAGLIASEDMTAAGYSNGQAFVEALYRCTRPFGGEVWLPTSGEQHAAFAGWVAASTGMPLSVVTRSNEFTRLQRTGLTEAQARLSPPMGMLWYEDYFKGMDGATVRGRIMADIQPLDLYSGLPLTVDTPGSEPAKPAIENKEWLYDSYMRTNVMYGFTEWIGQVGGYGCDVGFKVGDWHLERAGGVGYSDSAVDSGTLYISDGRGACSWPSAGVGNNVMHVGMQDCYCAYTIGAAVVGMIPMRGVESWAQWPRVRTTRVMDEVPIKRVGVNFGAPGDRNLQEENMFWVHDPKPSLGQSSPAVPVFYSGPVTRRYHHMSRLALTGERDTRWISASCVKGMTGITVKVSSAVVAKKTGVAPVVDGDLSDPCWTDAARVILPDTTNRSFMVRYDDSNLYIAGEMPCNYDDYPDLRWFGVRLNSREMRSGGVVLRCSLGGQKASSGLDASLWTMAWTGSASIPFRVEMAIPWAALADAGLWKEQLALNVHAYYFNLHGTAVDTGMNATPPAAYVPLYLDAARGPAGAIRPHTVRLYFAEVEGAVNAGQRVFDVNLQGQTVLTNFDICQAAGGADREVIREIANVGIADRLEIGFVPRAGDALISGVEIISTAAESNAAPLAVIVATPAAGAGPLTTVLSARSSADPDGQIAACTWDFGDGQRGTGSLVTHTYNSPGTYTVRLGVTDNSGGTGAGSATVVVGGEPADFVCRIRAGGGDYTNLAAWQAAIAGPLTASNSMVFPVTGRGSYAATDDGTAVTFTGGGTGTLKHITLDNVAYVTGCSGMILSGAVSCASGHTFTNGTAGRQVGLAVAECYNDWPDGLAGSVTLAGWTTDAARYVKIVAPAGQRHNGMPFLTNGTTYSGFAVIGNLDGSVPYTRLEGLIVKGTVTLTSSGAPAYFEEGVVHLGGIACNGNALIRNTMVIQAPGVGIGAAGRICNVTIMNSGTYGFNGGGTTLLRNVLIAGSGTKDYAFGTYYSQRDDASYCASGDGSVNDGGVKPGNRLSQTFSFVNVAGRNFHLLTADSGAKGWGCSLAGDAAYPLFGDIDGDVRMEPWDIGADQTPSAPRITSALTAFGEQDSPFSYSISAGGVLPIYFNTADLPDWLSFAGTTISGTPLTNGVFNVGLIASNSLGVASNTLVLTIVPPNFAPVVVAGPTAAPDQVAGTNTSVSVIGSDDAPESELVYTWSAAGSPPGPVSFSPNGVNSAKNSTATFTRAGAYTLAVVLRDAPGRTATGTVAVTVSQTPASVAVTPANTNLAVGQSARFAADGRDQFGVTLSNQPVFIWSVSGGGSMSSGLFTSATVGGPYTVAAEGGGNRGVAFARVSPANPGASLTLTNNCNLDTAANAWVALVGTNDSITYYPGGVYNWANKDGSNHTAIAGLNMNGRDVYTDNGGNLTLDLNGGPVFNGGSLRTSRSGAPGSLTVTNAGAIILNQVAAAYSAGTGGTLVFAHRGVFSAALVDTKLAGDVYFNGDAGSAAGPTAPFWAGVIDTSDNSSRSTDGVGGDVVIKGYSSVTVTGRIVTGKTVGDGSAGNVTIGDPVPANAAGHIAGVVRIGGVAMTSGPYNTLPDKAGDLAIYGKDDVLIVDDGGTAGDVLSCAAVNNDNWGGTVTIKHDGAFTGRDIIARSGGYTRDILFDGDVLGDGIDGDETFTARRLETRQVGTQNQVAGGKLTVRGYASVSVGDLLTYNVSPDVNIGGRGGDVLVTNISGAITITNSILAYSARINGGGNVGLYAGGNVTITATNIDLRSQTLAVSNGTLIAQATGAAARVSFANLDLAMMKSATIFAGSGESAITGKLLSFPTNAPGNGALAAVSGQTIRYDRTVPENAYLLGTASNGIFTLAGGGCLTWEQLVPPNPDVDGDGLPDAWETQYFGSTNAAGGAAAADWDADGMNNGAEWVAGTNPTNAASRLGVAGFGLQGPGGNGPNFVLQWSSVSGKWYAVDSSTNLMNGFHVNVESNIVATPDVNTSTIRVNQAVQEYFRIRVESR